MVLAQLLPQVPLDPKVAIETAKETFDLFRRDYLVASVVVMLAINAIWAWAYSRIFRELARVNEARVQDGKDGERRAEKLTDRMAIHMDRSAEAAVMLLNRPRGKP